MRAEKEIYKISLKRIFNSILFVLLAPLLILILHFTGLIDFEKHIAIYLGIYLVSVFNIALLVSNYYWTNYNSLFMIHRKDDKTACYWKDRQREIYFLDEEVCKIEKRSPFLLGKIPWFDLYYYVFTLKSGQKFIISCLMLEDHELFIINDKVYKETNTFFPFI